MPTPLPASVDAERTILGAILLDNSAYSEAAERLLPDDFSLDSHRRIFARMGEMVEAGRPVDIVTLCEQLDRLKQLSMVGDRAYIFSLTENLPRRLSIAAYVAIVKDKSILRQTIGICMAAQARCVDQSEDALAILNATETALIEVSEHAVHRNLSSIAEIVRDSFGSVDEVFRAQQQAGLRTHFVELDRLTSGLQRGDLVVIAARPSMGKTALAINIAQAAALDTPGASVAIFSLEMSRVSLLRRMLAAHSLVDQNRLRAGSLTATDRARLTDALDKLGQSRLYIDDTPNLSIPEMAAKARRLRHTAAGLDLIVLDYLQLMSASPGSGGRYENRVQEVSAITRGLKAIAKDLNVPLLALSQLSRASERREDRRPFLSDLRESGSIEQDADLVAFIHRDSYYRRPDDLSEAEKCDAEIIVAKQRNGPTGSFKLYFLAPFSTFANPAPRE